MRVRQSSPYIERHDGIPVAVQVARGLWLPVNRLIEPSSERNGELYWNHPLGGGEIADSSYAPDELAIPEDIRILERTAVLDNRGMIGQRVIGGNFTNPNLVSRRMTDADIVSRLRQKESGVTCRLSAIEAHLAASAFASLR